MAENIPGIYNYCDNWCDQCRFSNRCSNYNVSIEITDPESFFKTLEENISQATQILEKIYVKNGLESMLPSSPESGEGTEGDTYVEEQQLIDLANTYEKKASSILETLDKESIVSNIEHQLQLGTLNEEKADLKITTWNFHLEAIGHYLQVIPKKLDRAVRERKVEDLFSDNDDQRVSNGSAKVGLICIKKSIDAWEHLMDSDVIPEDDSISMLALLQKTQRLALSIFSSALAFIRPGFDDEGIKPT